MDENVNNLMQYFSSMTIDLFIALYFSLTTILYDQDGLLKFNNLSYDKNVYYDGFLFINLAYINIRKNELCQFKELNAKTKQLTRKLFTMWIF